VEGRIIGSSGHGPLLLAMVIGKGKRNGEEKSAMLQRNMRVQMASEREPCK
jgi:hypothetical protein